MGTAYRPLLGALAAAGAFAAVAHGSARAEDDDGASRERCATRLAIAILGEAADGELLAAAEPRAQVPALLQRPAFRERFARFLNATLSSGPGEKASEDAPYFLGKHLLEKNAPFRELFVGPYSVRADAQGNAIVADDPEGLGIFRSPDWLVRYAGNEVNGLKIATAYRILNNVTGVEITAVTTPPGADVTETGRKAAACRSCHYESWYALDSIATVLTRKRTTPEGVTFEAPPEGASVTVAGQTVRSDKELVSALVASKDFSYRACRLSFEFLYGRAESACEGDVFDACMAAFAKDGLITSALAAVAQSGSFCQ